MYNQTNTKASTPVPVKCSSESEYYDPVDFKDEKDNAISVNEGYDGENIEKIILMNPKFTGYFGYCRGSDTRGAYQHDGYDYNANYDDEKGGIDVKAVHEGEISKVIFGRPCRVCWLKDYFFYTKSLSFNKEKNIKKKNDIIDAQITTINGEIEILSNQIKAINNEIKQIDKSNTEKIKEKTREKKKKEEERKNKEEEKKRKEKGKGETINYCSKECLSYEGGCYGIQVFLKIEIDGKDYYAVYAHLSELDTKVFKPENFIFKYYENTLLPNPQKKDGKNNPFKVKEKQRIGVSGDTGNAAYAPNKHLHFECKESDKYGVKDQMSPNKIVKTEFKIQSLIDNTVTERIEPEDIYVYLKIINEWETTGTYYKQIEFVEGKWKKEIDFPKKENIKFNMKNGIEKEGWTEEQKKLWKKIYDEEWKKKKENGERKIDEAWEQYKKDNMSTFKEKINKEVEKEIKEEIDSKIRDYVFNSIKEIINSNWKKTETFKKQIEFVKGKWKTEIDFPENIKYNKVKGIEKEGWTEEQKKLWKKIYDEEWKKKKENGESELDTAYNNFKEDQIDKELDKNGDIYKSEIIKAFWKQKLAGKKANNALNEFRKDHKLIVGNIKESKCNYQELS